MSFTRPALRCHASIGGQKQTGSTRPCSSACSLAGCGASRTIATWRRFRPLRKRMPGARTANASTCGERTRIVNRMKSCLARLGIRTFKPTLRKAPDQLSALHTPEGVPVPPNTLDELHRDMARLHFVMAEIKAIETARLERLQQAPEERSHAMVRLLARVIGVG